MSKPDSGGPAFPQNDAVVNRINNETGMSLRDYFAAAAMQGMLSTEEGWQRDHDKIAVYAYEQADAMISRRANG